MSVEILDNGAEKFTTSGGITIVRQRPDTPYKGAIEAYVDGLNSRRGAVFSSNYEYPGRCTCWDTVSDRPAAGHFGARPLDVHRGVEQPRRVLLPIIARTLLPLKDVTLTQTTERRLALKIAEPGRVFTEEAALARAVGVHGAARNHRFVPH